MALEDYSYPIGWWGRIKDAWNALRGREIHGAEIILTPQTAFNIAAELVEAGSWLKKQQP